MPSPPPPPPPAATQQTELGYLGRYRQGDELSLVIQCVDINGSGAWPIKVTDIFSSTGISNPPTVTFRGPGGTNVLSRVLPADLQGVRKGVFRLSQYLGTEFATTGSYAVFVRYTRATINSGFFATAPIVLVGHFWLMAGGSPDGAVIAMRAVRRPNANWLIYQTDGGRLVRGRNPR